MDHYSNEDKKHIQDIERINQQAQVGFSKYINVFSNMCLVCESKVAKVTDELNADLKVIYKPNALETTNNTITEEQDRELVAKIKVLLNVKQACLDNGKLIKAFRNFANIVVKKEHENEFFGSFTLSPHRENTLKFNNKLTIHAKLFLQMTEAHQINDIIKDLELEHPVIKHEYQIVLDSDIQKAKDNLDTINLFSTKIGKFNIFCNLKPYDISQLDKLLQFQPGKKGKQRAQIYNTRIWELYKEIAEKMECKHVNDFRYIVEFATIAVRREIAVLKQGNTEPVRPDGQTVIEYYLIQMLKNERFPESVVTALKKLRDQIERDHGDSPFVNSLTAAYHYEKHKDILCEDQRTVGNYLAKALEISSGEAKSVKWSQDGLLRIYEYAVTIPDERELIKDVVFKHERLNGDTYIASCLRKTKKK